MRQTIRNALVGTPALVAAVPAERWFSPGAVVDQPLRMFVVLRWIAPVISNARNGRLNQLRVDVHDKRGSYKNIQQLLGNPDSGGGIYDVLSGILDLDGADGRVTQCDYLNHSGDQESEEYSTNYMFSSWQVIGVYK